jgi:hypothetical protein
MKTLKKALYTLICLVIFSSGLICTGCAKEEMKADGVAAPLVPGGAIVSGVSLQQENQKFSTLSNATTNNAQSMETTSNGPGRIDQTPVRLNTK